MICCNQDRLERCKVNHACTGTGTATTVDQRSNAKQQQSQPQSWIWNDWDNTDESVLHLGTLIGGFGWRTVSHEFRPPKDPWEVKKTWRFHLFFLFSPRKMPWFFLPEFEYILSGRQDLVHTNTLKWKKTSTSSGYQRKTGKLLDRPFLEWSSKIGKILILEASFPMKSEHQPDMSIKIELSPGNK